MNEQELILLVDDNSENIKVLSNFLEEENYNIGIATDGQAALDFIEKKIPDLILLDIKMPKLNGFETAARLQEDDRFKKIPIIFLTGFNDTEYKVKAFANGGVDYLSKPFNKKELLARINTHLRLKRTRENLEQKNKELTEKTIKINTLFDNAQQGFLFLTSDLLVGEQYSMKALEIFTQNIEKESFPKLIYPEDISQREFIKSTLTEIFNETSQMKIKSAYLPLLPEETTINGKYINLDYKLVKFDSQQDERILMVILTDVSHKKELEEQVAAEKRDLRQVVEVINNYNDFMDLVEEYKFFCGEELVSILNSNLSLWETVNYIFRKIHNFKGTFALFQMDNLINNLAKVEDDLAEFKSNLTTKDKTDLKNRLSKYNFVHWLDKKLDYLTDIVGENYFAKDNIIEVAPTELINLEAKIKKIVDNKYQEELLEQLHKIRYTPLKKLFARHIEYLEKLASKMDKKLAPVTIEGGEFLVARNKYHPFINSLVHIFRNMIDHGIEPPEERIKKDKTKAGTINCQLELTEEEILIIIADDGRGIDLTKLKEAAIKNDLYSPEELKDLSDTQLKDILFTDGLSTKEKSSLISGRGTGLAVVNKELTKLKGEIIIKTESGSGTEFQFLIPREDVLER